MSKDAIRGLRAIEPDGTTRPVMREELSPEQALWADAYTSILHAGQHHLALVAALAQEERLPGDGSPEPEREP